MRPRDVLSWKFWFYYVLLPLLRQFGPAGCDAVLTALGRINGAAWLPRRLEDDAALHRVQTALKADWSAEAVRPALAANTLRFLARDYPLEGASDDQVRARFTIDGLDALEAAMAQGEGAILLGSHLGAHIAALHGLYSHGVPLRLLVDAPVTSRRP